MGLVSKARNSRVSNPVQLPLCCAHIIFNRIFQVLRADTGHRAHPLLKLKRHSDNGLAGSGAGAGEQHGVAVGQGQVKRQ
jgi:hypothetical protein